MTHKKRILAVDDLRTQLVIYRSTLAHHYEVRACKSPLKALELLKTVKIDLIIVDIEMPEMTGFEFIRELRENLNLRDLPVLVISSHEDTADAVKYGASDFIKKPVKPAELRERIDKFLGEKDESEGFAPEK
jgi:PleD family two-component response regulator